MELSKMFVPTSAHLCKVEHHPAGAKLSHASADLSLSLSFSLIFCPTCSLWTILPRSSILLHPAANTSFVSLLHPRRALVYPLLPLCSSSPVVCFEIRRQYRLPPWFANSWFAKGVSHPEIPLFLAIFGRFLDILCAATIRTSAMEQFPGVCAG